MELTKSTLNTLTTLRSLKTEAKIANNKVETKTDELIHNIILNGIDLYVANKESFTSYNNFITAYQSELLGHVDENEKSIINTISLVTFALNKGLTVKATMKQIKALFKYKSYVTFSKLRDNKSITAEVTVAKKAYQRELKANNTALVATLEKKSSLQLGIIKEITVIMRTEAKKAEKKEEKDAKKKA